MFAGFVNDRTSFIRHKANCEAAAPGASTPTLSAQPALRCHILTSRTRRRSSVTARETIKAWLELSVIHHAEPPPLLTSVHRPTCGSCYITPHREGAQQVTAARSVDRPVIAFGRVGQIRERKSSRSVAAAEVTRRAESPVNAAHTARTPANIYMR